MSSVFGKFEEKQAEVKKLAEQLPMFRRSL
jgi:hypothetical protein